MRHYSTSCRRLATGKYLPGEKNERPKGRSSFRSLLLNNLQDLHGADLGTDSAGDALGSGILGFQHHDLHGAGLHALAAANALFLVNHVHTGLGILGNGLVLTGAGALAALDAGIGLGAVSLGDNADTGVVLVELLIKRL